jgi:hypothetical protein
LLVGSVIGALLVSRPWNKLFVMQHSLNLIGQIDVAKKLRATNAEELIEQIEGNFVDAAVQLSSEFDLSSGEQLAAMWVLKDYYEKYVKEIPPQLQRLFEGLAPNPLAGGECYKLAQACSSNPKCLKNPTSLQPLTDIPDPYGFTAVGKCGSKRRWLWRVPCGKPVTASVCF